MTMTQREAFTAEHADEIVLFYADVPAADRSDPIHHDVADAYAVTRFGEHPAAVKIWGLYHGEWQCNASGRWLVARLLWA